MAKTKKVKSKMRSEPQKPDVNLLWQNEKDAFQEAEVDPHAATKAKVAALLKQAKTESIDYGNALTPPPKVKKPATKNGFTAENVLNLVKYVDKKLSWGLAACDMCKKPSEDELHYLNICWQDGIIHGDGEPFWNDGINGVWGTPQFKWKTINDGQHLEWVERIKILQNVFNQFIANGGVLDDLNFNDGHVPEVETKPEAPKAPRQTQKAKGIEQLRSYSSRFNASSLPHLFVDNEQVKRIAALDLKDSDFAQLYSIVSRNYAQAGKIFARCCPMNPRHGFTDSIFVDAKDEDTFRFQIGALCKKMLKDDENGELVLMKPCFASFNIVLNDKAIVIGKGHDGATGGKGTFTLPISKPFSFSTREKAQIGISAENSVFSEFVGVLKKFAKTDVGARSRGGFQIESNFLTQLRGGPKIDVTGDFVPRRVVLDRDFLIPHCKEDGSEYRDTEWEKVINDVKKKDNWDKYFVLHKGGSISSHFGVHCFINEIPYIVSDVKVGKAETIEPNAKKRMAWDVEAFRRGFEKAPELIKLITEKSAVNILLTALHNYPALDLSDPKQAEFFGFSCGFAVYLSIATCLGELRYGKRVDFSQITVNNVNKLSREAIYESVLYSDFNYSLKKAFRKCWLFGVPNWGGGVGGLKWLECSEAAFDLWNAVCLFVEKGTKEALNKTASKLNKVVNVCHNNAKMLTKFGGDFDLGQAYPHHVALKMAPVIFELLNENVERSRIDFTSVEMVPEKWDSEIVEKRRKAYREAEGCPYSHDKPEKIEASEEPQASVTDGCGCHEHDCGDCYPDGYAGECNCYSCAHDSTLTAANNCHNGDCEDEHCVCDACN